MSMEKTFRSDFIIRFDEEYAKKMRGYLGRKAADCQESPTFAAGNRLIYLFIYDISRRT